MLPRSDTAGNVSYASGRCAFDSRISYAAAVLLDQDPGERFIWPEWLVYDEPSAIGAERGICIVPSGFFGEAYGTPGSLPKTPTARLDGLPILYGEPLVERTGNLLIVRADLLASAFFLLTRYEECVRRNVRDAHGRFPGRESLPFRAGFINRPVVDEYAMILRNWAREIGIDLPAPKRRFSVCLTHDVDIINVPRGPVQAAKYCASGLLRRRPWQAAIRASASALGMLQDSLDNLGEVTELDAQLEAASGTDTVKRVYFFMSGGTTSFDGNYDIRSSRARRWFSGVKAAGGTIGLHASYEAGQKPELVAVERRRLEDEVAQPVTMNRHHFLTWREPEDGHRIRAAGINWDSSLGYADLAGFRLGTCRPIRLFCPTRRELMGIEEHPLIVMDVSLSSRDYMNLDEDGAFEYVRELADATHRFQGEFVALWHNSIFARIDASYPYHLRLYKRVLQYLGELLGQNTDSVSHEARLKAKDGRLALTEIVR